MTNLTCLVFQSVSSGVVGDAEHYAPQESHSGYWVTSQEFTGIPFMTHAERSPTPSVQPLVDAEGGCNE